MKTPTIPTLLGPDGMTSLREYAGYHGGGSGFGGQLSGDSLTAQEALATLALSGDDDGPRQARSYQVMNGIAVLPVSGTLVSRTRALQPYSGMTGYNGIIARLQQAASDPMVDGILLDMDTPGGMVAGAFDCADIIARVRDIKPVWALANDMNCSAGQLLASAASRRLVTQTARTGSIGVMMAHSNYGAALEKQGVEITLIYSGSHKVDGNPYSHLPDDVRETLQSRMDATRRMFAQKVSAYTGLSVQAVLDTEAAVYSGQEAIDAGLADELVNSTDAITVMRDALDARKSRLSGGRMTKETQSTTVSATASQADVTGVVQATEGENASAAQPDVNAQITAAVAAENSRIMGILNCEEAHGREEQARVLAETPGMTVETARRILAAAPQSAQTRSDTALDRLMQGAPAPLAAGNPASDAVNDLLNTPVPGEQGQQALLAWFNEGDTRAYKIRFPNGTVDVFRGWVSSIGKAVTAKEVITRTVKVTNVGRPSMAEDRSTVTAATGMTVTPASTSVVKGQSTTLTVAFQPEGVTDKSFRAVSADKTKATVSVSGMTITVNGVAAGKVNIPVVSGNGEFAAVAEITVTAS